MGFRNVADGGRLLSEPSTEGLRDPELDAAPVGARTQEVGLQHQAFQSHQGYFYFLREKSYFYLFIFLESSRCLERGKKNPTSLYWAKPNSCPFL